MAGVMTMGLIVGILAMLFFTPYVMCVGIHIIAYDEIDKTEKLKCMIPIYNMFVYEPIYTAGLPWCAIFNIAFIVTFLIRLMEVAFGIAGIIGWITIALIGIALLGSYLCNAILVFRVLKDADLNGLGLVIVFAIIYPIGQYYIGTILPKVMRNALKEESTFL